MRRLIQFLFPFLFVRDWHSGKQEVSRLRAFVFCVAVGFIVISIGAIAFLQAPVSYNQYP
jgi:hypothetical protein